MTTKPSARRAHRFKTERKERRRTKPAAAEPYRRIAESDLLIMFLSSNFLSQKGCGKKQAQKEHESSSCAIGIQFFFHLCATNPGVTFLQLVDLGKAFAQLPGVA